MYGLLILLIKINSNKKDSKRQKNKINYNIIIEVNNSKIIKLFINLFDGHSFLYFLLWRKLLLFLKFVF